MTKTEDITRQTYTYTSMAEMMAHVATMGTAGFSLVSISSVALKAEYQKINA